MKVKEWIKEHKKEIGLTAIGAAITVVSCGVVRRNTLIHCEDALHAMVDRGWVKLCIPNKTDDLSWTEWSEYFVKNR